MLAGMLTLRPVTPDDAESYARVVSSIHPDEAVDPDVLRARWRAEFTLPRNQGRYLVVDEAEVCGLAFWSRPAAWVKGQPRLATLNVRMTPKRQSEAEFASILTFMEEQAKSSGAQVLRAVTREDEPFHRKQLERLGYFVDRLTRSWRLDLVARGTSLLAARKLARLEMHEIGVTMCTAANAQAPDVWHQLYDLTAATIPDIPTTIAEPVPTLGTWSQRMRSPDIKEDRVWTAWVGERLAGYSYLTYPGAGTVVTGYTATAGDHRRRGIARAIKLETIGQAIELGVESIKADNDLENTAIILINQGLGYQALPGLVTHLKRLTAADDSRPGLGSRRWTGLT
jgi:GNAT superfamily N-acetyltransferase